MARDAKLRAAMRLSPQPVSMYGVPWQPMRLRRRCDMSVAAMRYPSTGKRGVVMRWRPGEFMSAVRGRVGRRDPTYGVR